VVVGLDLDRHADVVRQVDDPGVVLEDAIAPLRLQLVDEAPEVGPEEAVDSPLRCVDDAPEGLVTAVLAQGLVVGLELDVGRPPLPYKVVVADVPELGEGETQTERLGDLLQVVVGGVEEVDGVEVEGVARLSYAAHCPSLSSKL
jgi:hypothetical protein